MPDLLDQLRTAEVFPPTPDLATAVETHLREEGAAHRGAPRRAGRRSPADRLARPRSRRPRLALALLAAGVLLPAGGALAFGDELLDWLGLRGAEVRRAPELPSGARFPALSDLGRPVALGRVDEALGFTPLVPRRLGAPDAVLVDGETRTATLVYRPRGGLPPLPGATGAGLLIAQTRGDLDRRLLGKTITADTQAEALDVQGDPGVFLAGEPHAYAYVAPGGDLRTAQPRLAGNTLVFSRAGRVIRIEAEAGRDRALALADELRGPVP